MMDREKVARAICEANGFDPEGLTDTGSPAHEFWLGEADAAIAAVLEGLRGPIQTVAAILPIIETITIRQAIEAGDEVIDACGLNPWCMNEGLADGSERALGHWKLEPIRDALAMLAAAK